MTKKKFIASPYAWPRNFQLSDACILSNYKIPVYYLLCLFLICKKHILTNGLTSHSLFLASTQSLGEFQDSPRLLIQVKSLPFLFQFNLFFYIQSSLSSRYYVNGLELGETKIIFNSGYGDRAMAIASDPVTVQVRANL